MLSTHHKGQPFIDESFQRSLQLKFLENEKHTLICLKHIYAAVNKVCNLIRIQMSYFMFSRLR